METTKRIIANYNSIFSMSLKLKENIFDSKHGASYNAKIDSSWLNSHASIQKPHTQTYIYIYMYHFIGVYTLLYRDRYS